MIAADVRGRIVASCDVCGRPIEDGRAAWASWRAFPGEAWRHASLAPVLFTHHRCATDRPPHSVSADEAGLRLLRTLAPDVTEVRRSGGRRTSLRTVDLGLHTLLLSVE